MQATPRYSFRKPPAVIVGVCAHGLAVLRALSARDVPLLVIDADASLPGARTRLAAFERVDDINGPALIDILLELRNRIACPGDPVLFLTNDAMVASVGAGVDRLAGLYRLSWAHCADRIVPLLDKATVARSSGQQGLRHPVTLAIRGERDVQRAADEIGFPCIVKPSRPLGGFKTYLPQTLDDLRGWVARHRADLPFVVQRYIAGDDRTIGFSALYLDRGRVLARYDGHKLRSYPLGHTTVAESAFDDEIHRQALRFFEGSGLSGPVSLEVKRAPDGSLWVIEPTVGRTDFWVGLCTANGVNLPFAEYCHQIGMPVPHMRQTDVAVWFNEERDPLGRAWFVCQPDLRLNGRGSVYLYLDRRDPRPALRSVVRTASRTGHRALRWLRRTWRRRATAGDFLPPSAASVDTCSRMSPARRHQPVPAVGDAGAAPGKTA